MSGSVFIVLWGFSASKNKDTAIIGKIKVLSVSGNRCVSCGKWMQGFFGFDAHRMGKRDASIFLFSLGGWSVDGWLRFLLGAFRGENAKLGGAFSSVPW
ncbi:MAG: hypothetical protein ACOYJE_10180 [Bacteroidaceae bacterium]